MASKEKELKKMKTFIAESLSEVLKEEKEKSKKKKKANHAHIVGNIITKERIKMEMEKIEKLLRKVES